jgi:hypothetical protein
MIGAVLDHLEHDRGNSARTRNARLAAIHPLLSYAAPRHPDDAAVIQGVLAIPPKRRYLGEDYDRVRVAAITEGRPDLRPGRRGLLIETRSARAAPASGKYEPAHG